MPWRFGIHSCLLSLSPLTQILIWYIHTHTHIHTHIHTPTGNYLLAIGKLYDESPTSRVLLAHQLINLTDTDTDASRETLWMLEVLHAWKEKEKGREGGKS
jgi:hypothetical protein